MRPSKPTLTVGIDFGSTNTRGVYSLNDEEPVILPIIPSYVGLTRDGYLMVGHDAKKAYYESGTVTYNLKSAVLHDEKINLGGSNFLAVSLVSELLRKIVDMAESDTGARVTNLALTVPCFFSELHKGALKDAAILANLPSVKIISEPTAALVLYRDYYFSHEPDSKRSEVLLLDSGGLTTDTAHCTMTSEGITINHVHGNNNLGGNIIDNRIRGYIETELSSLKVLDRADMRTIEAIAEGVKIEYEGNPVTVKIPFLDGKSLDMTIPKAVIEDAYALYLIGLKGIYEAVEPLYSTQAVLLIGGPFESQRLRSLVKAFIRTPIIAYPDMGFTVAKGAHLYAKRLGSKDLGTITDVIPMALGIETGKGYFSQIIPANTPYPHTFKRKFTTSEDYQSSMTIRIYQGNRLLTKDCFYLGSLIIDKLPLLKQGLLEVEVALSTTLEGLLSLEVIDPLNDIRRHITLSAPNRLTDNNKETLIKQLESYRVKRDRDHVAQLRFRAQNLLKEEHGNLSPNYSDLRWLLETQPLDVVALERLLSNIEEDRLPDSSASLPEEL